MNSIDMIILAVAVAYALTGYVQGFVVNLAGMLGLLTAGVIGLTIVPRIFDGGSSSTGTAMLALGLVVGCAALGQMFGTIVGSDLRQGIRSRPVRGLDALGGGVLGVVAVLIIGWAIGYSVSGSQIPYLSQASRESKLMRTVDGYMPDRATDVLRAFNRVLDASIFPRYLDPFEPEEIVETGPPDEATLQSPGVVAARASVVKILGNAVCGHGVEGTGFVYAPNRVMTNAHVVAGVREPHVVIGNREIEGTVVSFNPELDLAVIAVDNLKIAPLKWDYDAQAGDDAAVLGYPGNGPFDARAARIREEIRLQSPNIFGTGQVVRETYSIRSLVRSGNSGGPLIAPDGRILGVIFAASTKDAATGYAITADQAAGEAKKGVASTQRVDTQGCA